MTCTQRICLGLSLAGLASYTAAAQTNGLHWNVRQAGVAGDGERDCTAVFQKLLDEAGAVVPTRPRLPLWPGCDLALVGRELL